jgi:hypothetical protein
MTMNTFSVRRRLCCGAVMLLAAALTGFMAGCAPTQQIATPDAQRRTAIEGQIADSLSLAVNAQRELALTRDSSIQAHVQERTRLLSDRVSYDFYGDVEQIVRDIATKYGYDFKVYGQRPPEHVNVNIFVKKMPVTEVLKYVGTTANYWLDIHVSSTAIELIYKTKPGA